MTGFGPSEKFLDLPVSESTLFLDSGHLTSCFLCCCRNAIL